MSGGYSYTTLSARPDEPVRVGVSFYLDDRAWIELIGCGSDDPHLRISLGDVSVNICPCTRGAATAEDVQIARKLADQAAAYAAEIERRHATTPAPESGAAAA